MEPLTSVLASLGRPMTAPHAAIVVPFYNEVRDLSRTANGRIH
jgi:hypothetical protein